MVDYVDIDHAKALSGLYIVLPPGRPNPSRFHLSRTSRIADAVTVPERRHATNCSITEKEQLRRTMTKARSQSSAVLREGCG
jgi:hypothetical protein